MSHGFEKANAFSNNGLDFVFLIDFTLVKSYPCDNNMGKIATFGRKTY